LRRISRKGECCQCTAKCSTRHDRLPWCTYLSQSKVPVQCTNPTHTTNSNTNSPNGKDRSTNLSIRNPSELSSNQRQDNSPPSNDSSPVLWQTNDPSSLLALLGSSHVGIFPSMKEVIIRCVVGKLLGRLRKSYVSRSLPPWCVRRNDLDGILVGMHNSPLRLPDPSRCRCFTRFRPPVWQQLALRSAASHVGEAIAL
jgi:hypothetical protein